MGTTKPVLLAAAVLIFLAPACSAVPIDGSLDPDYGPALSTQTTQTHPVDAAQGALDYARGSELDQGFGFISGGVLYLFLSGNLAACCPWEFSVEENLDIFLDSQPGGQNPLRADNPGVNERTGALDHLGGLTFDGEFVPDYWLSRDWVSAYYAELPAQGGGAGYWLGRSSPGGPGTLTGGTNPFGILETFDERNVGGVPAGCDAASGAGVTTGMEWAIPLAAIGNPTGCIKVCAFIASEFQSSVRNQVLGPLPTGTCDPGAAGAVSFAAIQGPQYFTACPTLTSVSPQGPTWGQLKARYR